MTHIPELPALYSIEAEKESDFPEIYELVRTAFLTAEHADGDEHDYVNELRTRKSYLPELALCVKTTTQIIGHIMLTGTVVQYPDGGADALLLSPVCVHPDYHRQGVASRLIGYTLDKAREKGYGAVFLVGNPDFYRRFGFRAVSEFGIKNLGDFPDMYAQGLELVPGYLGKAGGALSIC